MQWPQDPSGATGGSAGQGAVLITGCTGFVGMELLARFLERTDRRVYALVRGTEQEDADRRLRRTVRGLVGSDAACGERVIAVPGDITRPGLGLEGPVDRLAEEVTDIVHG